MVEPKKLGLKNHEAVQWTESLSMVTS